MAQSLKRFMIVFALSLVLLTCFTFGACSNLSPFKDGPNADDVVVGNGSLAVSKGDYLYFVNGFQNYSSVGDTNKEGKVTYSALYRIKLDENGNPVSKDAEYDEDGNVIFDGSRALKDVDILASKVVGFEYMGLYIFDDYIYYATPNNGVDKDLKTETQYVSFFKKKLDRSGDAELLYTTKAEGSKVTYSMLEFDGNVYLTVLDDSTLVVIKNGKDKKEIENVTGAVFASYSKSIDVVTDFNKDIYYTRSIDSEKDPYENGNVLCKFSLSSMSGQDVFADDDSTFTLKAVSTTKLYYEKVVSSSGSSSATLWSISGVEDNKLLDEAQVTSNSYSNYYLLPDQANKVLVNTGSALRVIANGEPNTVYSGSATVVGVNGNYVYFTTSDNKIMRANYMSYAEAETVVEENAFVGQANYVCVTDQKVYYLSTDHTNNSKYLHEVDLETNEDYFVGVLEEADYDTEE